MEFCGDGGLNDANHYRWAVGASARGDEPGLAPARPRHACTTCASDDPLGMPLWPRYRASSTAIQVSPGESGMGPSLRRGHQPVRWTWANTHLRIWNSVNAGRPLRFLFPRILAKSRGSESPPGRSRCPSLRHASMADQVVSESPVALSERVGYRPTWLKKASAQARTWVIERECRGGTGGGRRGRGRGDDWCPGKKCIAAGGDSQTSNGRVAMEASPGRFSVTAEAVGRIPSGIVVPVASGLNLLLDLHQVDLRRLQVNLFLDLGGADVTEIFRLKSFSSISFIPTRRGYRGSSGPNRAAGVI